MASPFSVELPILGQNEAPVLARSRNSKWRFLTLGIVQVLIILHVVLWLVMGTTTTPIEPSEAMETVKTGAITVGTIFFAAAILSTLIFGRFFCGWGCHIILLQDACGAGLKKLGLRPRPFRSRLLLWLPLTLALYMFVWPLVHRFIIAPWQGIEAKWPGFSWELTTTEFWSSFPGLLMAVPFLLVCGFLTIYLLGMKGYCTYACPYGGIFAPAEQVSPVRIRVNDDCEQCGHCTAVCTSNVRVHEEVAAFGMVVDPGCMKCLDCVSVCPNDALSVGLGRPAIAVPAEERSGGAKRHFDLSWTEEIVFAVVAIAVLLSLQGAYFLPLLFASGVTAIVTWGLWKAWRICRDKNASFHRWRLKIHGQWRVPGRLFVAAACLVLFALVDIGVVNGMAFQAGRLDDRVSRVSPPQMVFSINGVVPEAEMAKDARRAIALYSEAGFVGDRGWSIIGGKQDDFALRQAWLYSVLREFPEAMVLLDGVIERNGLDENSALARGRLLRVLDPRAVDGWYDEVLGKHPKWILLRDERILLRTERNDLVGAISEARVGVEMTPDSLLALRRLAVLLLDHGGPEGWAESGAITRQTLAIEPLNPGAWRALALSLGKLGDLEGAETAMAEAVRLVPLDHRFRAQFALLLNDRGKRENAEEQFALALRLWEAQGSIGDAPQLPAPPMGPVQP